MSGITRRYAAFAAAVLIVTSARAYGQTVSPGDAAAAALTAAKAAATTVGAVARPAAMAAVEAATKAAEAAQAVAGEAGKLMSAVEAGGTTLEALKAAADATAKAAQAAAAAAAIAARSAATAAGTIDQAPAMSIANQAHTRAAIASGRAGEAAAAAIKATANVASAKTPESARKDASAVGMSAGNAASETAATARETAVIAIEAVRPSLPVTTESDESLLAALRARITGGAIFFNGSPRIVPNEAKTGASFESNQFSQAATYLAIEAQPRLWSADFWFCRKNVECTEERQRRVNHGHYQRLYVDPFVNVRLTTIAVAGTSTTTTTQAPTAAFLQSQKAVQLQMGAITGLNFGGFQVTGNDFHWGIGPVYRFMFQNVTDSQRALRLWDVNNDLFKLWTFGTRLTLYSKNQMAGGSPRPGWTPAAYVDVSRGKFENFETAIGNTDDARSCLQNPAACLVRPGGIPPESEFTESNKTRWYVEGRVFLQYLYLGFDLNTGTGADDLRFIGGITVKLDQFITRRN